MDGVDDARKSTKLPEKENIFICISFYEQTENCDFIGGDNNSVPNVAKLDIIDWRH